MSGARWEYHAEGSGGPGHLQRVASNGQFTRVQRAYRAYIDHATDCRVCAVDSTQCADAGALWAAYQKTTT